MMDNETLSEESYFSYDENPKYLKLTIKERIIHSNWSARLSGYQELIALFTRLNQKQLNEFAEFIPSFVSDPNPAAQERGLAATLIFINRCSTAHKHIELILPYLASKCLTLKRQKSKEIVRSLIFLSIEKFERSNMMIEELLKASEDKNAKKAAASVAMLRTCLNHFGDQVPIKPMALALESLFKNRNALVREEAKNLAIEIYQWAEGAVFPYVISSKPILYRELQKKFHRIDCMKKESLKQLLVSSQASNDDSPTMDNELEQQKAEIVRYVTVERPKIVTAEEPVDEIYPIDSVKEVDIFYYLPSDFTILINSPNWIERRDALSKLVQLLKSNPKLVMNAQHYRLIFKLKKMLAHDTNVSVTIFATKSIILLASILKKSFYHHARTCIPIFLERFKVKKVQVVEVTREGIDTVYALTSLEEIRKNVLEYLKNKNPSIRSETALFLARCFAKRSLINRALWKVLTEALLKTLKDPVLIVRQSSTRALEAILKALGDQTMFPLMVSLKPARIRQIRECCAAESTENKVVVDTMKPVGDETPSNDPNKTTNTFFSNKGNDSGDTVTELKKVRFDITKQISLSEEDAASASSSPCGLMAQASTSQLPPLANQGGVMENSNHYDVYSGILYSNVNFKLTSSNGNTTNQDLVIQFDKTIRYFSSKNPEKILKGIKYLKHVLDEESSFKLYLEPKIDEIVALCGKQFRLFAKQIPQDYDDDDDEEEVPADPTIQMVIENTGGGRKMAQKWLEIKQLFRSVSSVLNKIFLSPMGKQTSTDTLRELINGLVFFLVGVSGGTTDQTVFYQARANNLIDLLFLGSDLTNLFCALVRLLHYYVDEAVWDVPADQTSKHIKFTLGYLWRAIHKAHRVLPNVDVDRIFLDAHLFFKRYPRSWWSVNNRDIAPFRAMRGLIYVFCQKKGLTIFNHLSLIEEPNDSDIVFYIHRSLNNMTILLDHSLIDS